MVDYPSEFLSIIKLAVQKHTEPQPAIEEAEQQARRWPGFTELIVKMAKRLPVAAWVLKPEQAGFGLLSLATVVGECGDLCNYANPGKVWRRLGSAPWTFNDKTLMGATWRGGKEGKLPSEEWEKFGYSPRRRSIAFLFGENIVKQNFMKPPGDGESASETETATAASGPYRERYDTAKVAASVSHPDWKPMRCHRHAMLLATKRLLRNLWIEWRRQANDLPEDAWKGKPNG